MTDPLFTLSSAVEPAIPFDVDGDTYELRTISHLNKLEEAHIRALVKLEKHHLAVLEALPGTASDKIEAQTLKLVDIRCQLIEMMTTVPRSLIDALSTVSQVKLVAYISVEVGKLRETLERAQAEALEAAALTDAVAEE